MVKPCPVDGFVSANAGGYRLREAGTYPGALMGATLIPSFTFGQDVNGYSHDGVFIEGRRTLRPAVRAEWGRQYFADLIYTRFEGGKYFTEVDRDTLTLGRHAVLNRLDGLSLQPHVLEAAGSRSEVSTPFWRSPPSSVRCPPEEVRHRRSRLWVPPRPRA